MKGSILTLGLVLSIGVVACGGEEPTFPEGSVAVRASSDLAVGTERLLVGVAAPDGTRLGSPEDPVTFQIAPIDAADRTNSYPAEFTWIVPDVVGIYRATVEFDVSGPWQVTVVPESGPPPEPTAFEVQTESLAPAIGDRAPSLATPTTSDRPLEQLTTDPDPEPSFYDVSLDAALDSGAMSVVVFATPKFCRTASCGPMLESIKGMTADHPGVEFLHLEVYDGFWEPGFAPDAGHLTDAVVAWNLPSEPWVFVVGPDGTVAARFEGVLDPAELQAALS